MNRARILLFIAAVIAALALVCVVFPEDGLALGSVTLRFPSMEKVLTGEEKSDEPSPEELMQQRAESVARARREALETYFREDPARFILPGNGYTYFDGFFAKLDGASRRGVRIMHYGDSQIEEDRISKVIRARLQERFGGGGPGLLPCSTNYTLTCTQTATAEFPKYIVFGEGNRTRDGRYGPAGRFHRLAGSVKLSTRMNAVKGKPLTTFNRVTVLSGNVKSRLVVGCGSQKDTVAAGTQGLVRSTFCLPDSTVRTSISLQGGADIYGVMLDCDRGVSLDNIAMRGCSGSIFTKMDSGQLRDFWRDSNVGLVLLQFGGNMVPFTKSPEAISAYKKDLEEQIMQVRRLAPKAAVVLVGPSDMATSRGGRMQTYEHLPRFIDSLKVAAKDCGVAYWDIYSAMGGQNSMASWVKAKPQLAGPDYVHFTPRGAEKIGDLFVSSLMLYYEGYKNRRQWTSRR